MKTKEKNKTKTKTKKQQYKDKGNTRHYFCTILYIKCVLIKSMNLNINKITFKAITALAANKIQII